jgi:hypothetical protein
MISEHGAVSPERWNLMMWHKNVNHQGGCDGWDMGTKTMESEFGDSEQEAV